MGRTAFLVDGFNLYHSLKEAQRALGGRSTRWLDLRSFCSSYLSHIGRTARLGPIGYYSALARHRLADDPQATTRHLEYITCLRATGVVPQLAKFKRKESPCPHCGLMIRRYEEKETDVAIAVGLIELFHQAQCDIAVVVTGDSDITPAVRTAASLFPDRPVLACFPYNRQSLELKEVVSVAFQATKEAYARHQFPDPFILPDGRRIPKPTRW